MALAVVILLTLCLFGMVYVAIAPDSPDDETMR